MDGQANAKAKGTATGTVRVARVITGREQPEGDGMVVRRAFPGQALGRIDPFLLFDEMGPHDVPPGLRAGFPDHPHRGFETVTYVLSGEIEHKDSHGNKGRIGPGDVQWMTAGAGVVHSEMPGAALRRDGGRLHGFQLWVNLPARDKMMPPRYQERPSGAIPEAKVPGGRVRVIAGAFGGVDAPLDTRTPIQYLHAVLDPGAAVDLPVPPGHQGFVYVAIGSGTAGGQALRAGQMGVLGGDAGTVRLEAGPQGVSALLVSGVPLGEPVFQYGPFVMTTREEIMQAISDFQAGRFGTIPASAA
jgi:quercetin 2,3-dioxygenase